MTLTAPPPPPDLHDPVARRIDDLVIKEARRRARRRRGIYAAVVVILAALLIGVGMMTPDGTSVRGGKAAPAPARAPAAAAVVQSWTGIPWCVADPLDPNGEELIVGAGAPIKTFCSYTPMHDGPAYCPAPCPTWDPQRANKLIHHAGITILLRMGGVYRVADGQLTRLDTGSDRPPGMSHDGRYLATQSGQCGQYISLSVYEVATANEVARTKVPNLGSTCTYIAGIDDLGRIYLTVAGQDGDPYRALMYDVAADQWSTISGIPTLHGRVHITYVTADGFAVSAEERWLPAGSWWLPLASVEGVVDAAGRYTAQRQVPVGAGLWSPDRSLVAEQRMEGMVVRAAADLTQPVVLDLPVDQFRGTADGPGSNFQWESPSSLLVQGEPTARFDHGGPAYRCDARSGACTVIDREGVMAANIYSSGGG